MTWDRETLERAAWLASCVLAAAVGGAIHGARKRIRRREVIRQSCPECGETDIVPRWRHGLLAECNACNHRFTINQYA
jgi:ribosomal protein L37AE/L43A